MSQINECFCLWSTGYAVHQSLGVEIIGETEKAYKFKLTDNPKCSFYLPKKALSFDTTTVGIVNLARWFKMDEFLSSMFNRYASHYRR